MSRPAGWGGAPTCSVASALWVEPPSSDTTTTYVPWCSGRASGIVSTASTGKAALASSDEKVISTGDVAASGSVTVAPSSYSAHHGLKQIRVDLGKPQTARPVTGVAPRLSGHRLRTRWDAVSGRHPS